jgi:single-strand DNA-binding protein
MKGVNRVIVLGNVGKDPEIRSTTDGTCIVNLSVATSEKYKDKSGKQVENTEWHRVSAFGKLAEIIRDYVTKGSKVYIEGKLKTRSYEKEGVKMYTTEIVASEMQMLDGKGDKPQAPQGDNGFDDSDIPFN